MESEVLVSGRMRLPAGWVAGQMGLVVVQNGIRVQIAVADGQDVEGGDVYVEVGAGPRAPNRAERQWLAFGLGFARSEGPG